MVAPDDETESSRPTGEEQRYARYLDEALKLLIDPDAANPSARALVDRLGGSLTTANKAMQVFWRHIASRLAYQQQYPEGMPLDVIKMVERLMATARDAAAREWESEKALVLQREQQCIAEQEAAMEKLAICEQQIGDAQQLAARHRQDYAALANQNVELNATLQQRSDEISTLNLRLTDVGHELALRETALEQITAHHGKLEQQQAMTVAQLDDLQQIQLKLEKQTSTLETELARVEQRNHQADRELRRYGEVLEHRESDITSLSASLAEAIEARRQMTSRVAQLTEQLSQADQAVSTSHAEQLELRLALQSLTVEHAEQGVHLLRLPLLEQQIDDLRAERDRLLAWLDTARKVAQPGNEKTGQQSSAE